MSGPPPGPGGPGARSMSVSNGPPSAGMPPPQHMQSQQANVPPPAGASGGSQSQQNLNQIVGPFCSSCLPFALSSTYYPPTATGSPLEPNSMKPLHAEADVSNMSTLNPPLNAHSKGSYAPYSIWSQQGNIWSILAPSPSSKTATLSHLAHTARICI